MSVTSNLLVRNYLGFFCCIFDSPYLLQLANSFQSVSMLSEAAIKLHTTDTN